MFGQPPPGPLLNEDDFDDVAISFATAPLDDLPEGYTFGDDSLLKDGPIPDAPVLKSVRPGGRISRTIIVPHPRDLHLGMRGPDVEALQRALATAHFRKWGLFTRLFGLGTKRCVVHFQKAHALKPDGIYGILTHRKLARYYDAYGIRLLNQVHVLTPTERHRARLLAAANVAYNYGGRIHYSQGLERMWLVRHHVKHEQLPQQPYIVEDCSSFATWLYWDAGDGGRTVPDPNGLGFNGSGFTGTLGAHGTRISFTNVPVGALYFYGYPPYKHVTISVGNGRCISQGGEDGPNLLAAFFEQPYTCHRYQGL